MAPVQPAGFLQNRTDHPAQLWRMTNAGLLTGAMQVGDTSPQGGVHPAFGGRLAVTGTAGMNVNVATGLVYMAGSTAWQGEYSGYNTATYSVSVPAASVTQWRRDYIVARQLDTAYGQANDNWDIIDVPGTNSSTAPGSLPSIPNNAVVLAIVNVTPNMSVTNGAGTVQDARQYSPLSGKIYTTSASKPPLTAPEGTEWYETDTHLSGIIINGAYYYMYPVPASGMPLDTWHPLPTLHNGWTDNNPGGQSSAYRRRPSDPTIVEFMASLSAGTTADSTLIMTMPSGYRPGQNYQRLVVGYTLSAGSAIPEGPFFQIATDGSVTCQAFANVINNVYVNGSYRLS